MTPLVSVNKILQKVLSSGSSDFYSRFYKERGVALDKFDIADDFEKLPEMDRDYLSSVLMNERQYLEGDGLVKIVKSQKNCFLIKRTLADLSRENYGVVDYHRPLILLGNDSEVCEKSLWFYEKNVVPLVGDINLLSVSGSAAKDYGIDALFTETGLIKQIWPLLLDLSAVASIKSIIFAGDNFDLGEIRPFLSHFNLRVVLSLSEAGAFAHSCPEALKKGELVFHPDENCVLETKDSIILTKLIFMPTPLIRYNTGIAANADNVVCGCAAKQSFSIKNKRGAH